MVVKKRGKLLEKSPEQVEEEADVARALRIRRGSDVKIEKVRWIWPSMLPLGKLTIGDGDPSLGKSLITLDVAARVTRGWSMPPGPKKKKQKPANVVILAGEDDWQDTIAPRLIAAGADMDRVVWIELERDKKGNVIPLTIPEDMPMLRTAIEDSDAALLVIDPIMAYLGATTNSHQDASVRRALLPLQELAKELRCAVLLIRHLNKAGELKALYRGGGSIAFSAAARSGWIMEKHPEESGRVVLAQTKSNLARRLTGSYSYYVETIEIEIDGEDVEEPIIVWGDMVELTADQLMSSDSRKNAPEREECWRHAKLLLAEQDPRPAKDMEKRLVEAGHSRSTIGRMKRDRNIQSVPLRNEETGKTEEWQWTLKSVVRIGPKAAEGPELQGLPD